MGRLCSICPHPDVRTMERLVLAGNGIHGVAKEFGVTRDALRRHWENHGHTKYSLAATTLMNQKALPDNSVPDGAQSLPADQVATVAQAMPGALDLVLLLHTAIKDTARLQKQLEANSDHRGAIVAIQTQRQNLETALKIVQPGSSDPSHQVSSDEDTAAIIDRVLTSLADMPEARERVAEALLSAD